MLKRILAIILSIIPAIAIITGGEILGGRLYPLPDGLDYHDKAQLKTAIAAMPVNASLLLLATYAVAAFAGGLVATLISRTKWFAPKITDTTDETTAVRPAFLCGIILTGAGISNGISMCHPVWFIIANGFVYIPFALMGYAVAKKK